MMIDFCEDAKQYGVTAARVMDKEDLQAADPTQVATATHDKHVADRLVYYICTMFDDNFSDGERRTRERFIKNFSEGFAEEKAKRERLGI